MGHVISAEDLGKKYLIGHAAAREKYVAFRDVITQMFRGFAHSALDIVRGRELLLGDTVEEFWALKGVSFDINRGDVVGIIGRNGAGKSTLLKILSRITEPSAGRIEIKGRVASLLEVGTGFHPELTGRENIYLNGAILGMAQGEVRRKFDEIVDFSGVEKFLDTPVKRFSSGMYVRLAFAVAAHLEPEILIIDEVLAVGDAEFQQKCLGRMRDVASGDGRTVLFVSHNIGHIMSLCNRAIWLNAGRVKQVGDTETVVSSYVSEGATNDGEAVFTSSSADVPFAFRAVRLLKSSGKTSSSLDVREPFDVQIDFDVLSDIPDLEVSFRITNAAGVPVFSSNRSRFLGEHTSAGQHCCAIQIPAETLMPGRYVLTLGGFRLNGEIFEVHDGCLGFTVEETGSHMARYQQRASEVGVVLVHFPWREVSA